MTSPAPPWGPSGSSLIRLAYPLFAQEFRIRLMDPDKQQQSESLRDNSKVFIEKVQRLGDIVSGADASMASRLINEAPHVSAAPMGEPEFELRGP